MANGNDRLTSSAGAAIAVVGLLAALGGSDDEDDNGGSDPGDGDPDPISETYNGQPKADYYYCGSEDSWFDQWQNLEITTDTFASRTSSGEGTAQLQLEPCPDPNESPSVSVTGLALNNGILDVSASGSDPDGSIASYDWTLTRSGQHMANGTGTDPTFDLQDYYGEYTVEVVAADNDGATASDTRSFTYQEPDPDPEPNEDPSVSIDGFNVNSRSGTIDAQAAGSDPDGQIVAWDWELTLNASRVDTASGQSVTMDMAGSGDYLLKVTGTDDDGATDTAVYSFPYEAPSTNDPPTATITGFTTDNDAGTLDASGSGNDPDGSIAALDWTFERNGTVVDTATGSDVTLNYAGSGTYTLTLTATDDDGAQATDSYEFDYEDSGGGDPGNGDDPYYETIERTGSKGKTAAISVFQTEALHDNCGRSPEYTVAMALADAIEYMGYSVVVKHGMPPLPAETEASGCNSGGGYDNGALGWFQEYRNNGNIPDEYMSKDSNIMLVDELGGGCGESGGGDLCIAGANRFDSYFEWEPILKYKDKDKPGNEPYPRVQTLNHCIHEVGHNFDMAHGCGVIEKIDSTEEVVVPLNHPGEGGTNECGDVSDERPQDYTWYLKAYWDSDCCRDLFDAAIK